MNSKQMEVLNNFFTVLLNPPPLLLDVGVNQDEPVILIDNGLFSIRDATIVHKSIGRQLDCPGFALDMATHRSATRPEYDYSELFLHQNYLTVAAEAVRHYASWQVQNMLNENLYESLALEMENAKKADNNAYNEGGLAYKNGNGDIANPYPYGISVYYKWRQGWNNAETERFNAEHQQVIDAAKVQHGNR